MNERTSGMFADDVHWPGLVASGNLEVDPQFGSSFNDIIYNNTGCGDGFKDYFRVVRSNEVGTVAKYGYKLETVEGDNWIPLWPLPELQDMQYSNAALRTGGTDGKPVGDPGWFTGGITAVDKDKVQLPEKFVLENAFPNPFNPSTTIKFNIAKDGNVNLKIFDILGQSVKTILNNDYKNKGTYEFNVDMSGFANGLYFYTLQQNEHQVTKKMILLK
jgi:hypothetical protein